MDMKRDYYEDVQLFSSGVVLFWFLLLLAFLAALPFFVKNYYIYMANYMAINIIVAVGLNLLVGYTGQISLGHAGFFALGAYGTVILMSKAHLPFLLALPASALFAALLGFLLGLPALRLEGPYLSIATLGFGLTITQVIGRIEFFGGRQGLHTPDLTIGPWHLESDRDLYYLLLLITVVLVLGARNLIKTKVGRAFIAIRDADIAAETMGVNLTYYKTLAFAVSAFYTGIAGGLFAFVLRFIEPEIFGMMMSVIFLAMVVVGGLGSLFGSIAGACLLSWLDLQLRNILSIPYFGEWLDALSKSYFSITGVSNIQFIVYGLIMVLIMIFEPLGIYGFWIRTKIYWKTWPF
ncbi:MAG TPA: branched-chain amino acid ABC transporter permease [Deltaproteobacteria bacterium]|nr:branched-chain amino acid ABC transporter permease [Deltaproteobacteria bacterium]HIJ35776.1 branched-chain amino acid ABC transporter permease [Deltaproteobacteria bacterium]HIJ40805.1 branched-chain amino acid ABC transporter permease [Deltaproteobacteria bacterium]